MRHDLIRVWLRLPAEPWPPDPHTLLGLEPGITDSGAIEEHARQRMQQVRAYQLAHPDEAAEAMSRLAQALVCLTEPEARKSPAMARLPQRTSPEEAASDPADEAPVEEPSFWPDDDDEVQDRRTRGRMRRSMLWVGILLVVVSTSLIGGVFAYRSGALDRLWTTAETPAPPDTVHEVRRITGFSGAITCLAYAPDGGRFVTGGDDHLPRLWDARTGKESRKFSGHTGNVRCAIFSPDGKKLLTGGEDKTARLWDVELGVELVRFEGHDGAVTCAAFSTDGRRVLTGSDDQTVRLWDANDDIKRDGFSGHGGPVTAVAFAADGRRGYSCGKDNTLRVWDLERGQELRRTSGRLGTFLYVAFLTDGRQVFSAEGDRVRLDDLEGKRDPRLFPACGARVTSVAVSRDGKRALAGDEGGGLHLWDVESGKELGRWAGHKGAVTSVALSPDGSRALSGGGDQTMRVWQMGE